MPPFHMLAKKLYHKLAIPLTLKNIPLSISPIVEPHIFSIVLYLIKMQKGLPSPRQPSLHSDIHSDKAFLFTLAPPRP